MQFVLLIVGCFLIFAGVVLVFLRREVVSAAVLLFPGLVMCLIGVPGVDNVAFGIQGSFKKQLDQGLKDTKLDIKQEDTAPLKLDIQKINDALVKQDSFNKSVTSTLNKMLQERAPTGGSPIVQPNINSASPTFTANNQYSVFVFFRESRAQDSKALVDALTASGFQTSAITTTLAETQIGPQPDNSTFIIPTDKGEKIAEAVRQTVQQNLPSPRNGAVTLGGPYPLRRGDVQIFLF